MIRAIPRERYVELYGPDFDAPVPPAASSVNAEAVLALAEPGVVWFRGRKYRCALASFEDGVRLFQVAERIRLLSLEDPFRWDAFVVALRDTADLCWSLMKPQWCPALLWRLRRNRLRRASVEELQAVLADFARARMLSLVLR